MVIIEFEGDIRKYRIEDSEGWANAMISLMQSKREFKVYYSDL